MLKKVTTLTDFILEEEKKFDTATGSLTLLLVQIEKTAKVIASHLKSSGLVDVLGKTGDINTYGDEVEKLDDFANSLMIDTLLALPQVHAVASEETEDIIYSKDKKGEYIVFFDPIDGSGNLDTNLPLGTIFSIYRKNNSGSLLQKGREQIVAGYVLYSTSVVWVHASRSGVNGFILDPSVGSFLLSHPDIKIVSEKNSYSINEGNFNLFDKKTQNYLKSLKNEPKYEARYIGAMVADVHRMLLKGGIFMNPANKKRPNGKLRLIFEVNPMSFIVEQAGGLAVSRDKSPLDIVPESISQTAPIALGSKKEVEKYKSFLVG